MAEMEFIPPKKPGFRCLKCPYFMGRCEYNGNYGCFYDERGEFLAMEERER